MIGLPIWVVMFVVWNHSGHHNIPGSYPSRFECDQATAELATILQADKTIVGWTVVLPCAQVPETRKS